MLPEHSAATVAPQARISTPSTPQREGLSLGTRWLGAGLASCLAVVTLGLWLTDRLSLYINPAATWWVVSMSIIALVASVASCAVRLRGEHDHAHPDDPSDVDGADLDGGGLPRRSPLAAGAVAAGGVLASVLVVAAVVLPPASLSTELALERSSDVPPRLAGAASLELVSAGDTAQFGIGEWASIMTTTTNPRLYAGDEVSLTGFVGEASDGGVALTRLVIVHCVIDAQAASVPVALDAADFEPGQWIDVTGTVTVDASGRLVVEPETAAPIDEPADPYEY